MLKEAICTGVTIEEARARAVAELAAPEDVEVKIEVLEMPVKKTLGFLEARLQKYERPMKSLQRGKQSIISHVFWTEWASRM